MMRRHLMERWILSVLTLAMTVGCEPHESDVSVDLQPNLALRTQVEQQAIQPTGPPQGAKELRGRLEAAESLVGGFEVPRNMHLIRRHPDYLVYEIRTGISELTEFYTGLDRHNGYRFTKRTYRLKKQKNGFDVLHSPESQTRLGHTEHAGSGHIYIKNINRRSQHLRIHPPVDEQRRQISVRSAIQSTNSQGKGRASGSVGVKTTSTRKAKESGGRVDPFRMTSSGRAFRNSAEARPQKAHARQYAPYGKGRIQSVRSRVEQWKVQNPGKQFQD